jgi:hypothetical protein
VIRIERAANVYESGWGGKRGVDAVTDIAERLLYISKLLKLPPAD